MKWTLDITEKTRTIFKDIIENTSLGDLNKVPEGFNNNIVWNIAHTIVTPQLLVYRLSGNTPRIPEEMIEKYKKGTKPTRDLTQAEVDELKALLFSTLEELKKDYANNIFSNYQEYTVSTNNSTITNVDEALEFSNFHDGLHLGYILALRRAL